MNDEEYQMYSETINEFLRDEEAFETFVKVNKSELVKGFAEAFEEGFQAYCKEQFGL
jgi:hypothetical protein